MTQTPTIPETMKLMNIGLPKWPQLIIVGEDIPVEIAKEIIFRTDDFLTDASDYSGGNAKDFNKLYRAKSGLHLFNDEVEGKSFQRTNYDKQERLREILDFVHLGYVYNRWASSAFAYGPTGFCSPEGKILFTHNIGKYPSTEEVYNDFVEIAKAFPMLDMKAALYDLESCQDEDENGNPKQFLVGFIIKNGEVTITGEDLFLHLDERVENASYNFLDFADPRCMGEIGLPQSYYEEYAARVSDAVNKVEYEFQTRIEKS